ncbi:glucose-6-phosphate isomerase [Clostridia bacterium]|nr:glucose-6-phosphate isomerase [Clostridia bacterium]
MIRIDKRYLGSFLNQRTKALDEEVKQAQASLEQKQCLGSEYTGWVELVESKDEELIEKMTKISQNIRDNSDALLVIGIGGSYLGAKAALNFLGGDFPIYFLGQNLSSHTWLQVQEQLAGKDFYVNFISKSGGTLEPALAFRLARALLEERYKENWHHHVIATTDAKKGKLKEFAQKMDMETLVVPDDIGGRYSVLTPVGLLPLLCAGVDVHDLLEGAKRERADILAGQSDALEYTTIRNALYRAGKAVEIMVTYNPALNDFCEWWKQLFGESEGKNAQGLFPASACFTRDLHSLGQFIQSGTDFLMETVLWVDNDREDLRIPTFVEDTDGLDYLAGESLNWINKMACEATMKAHLAGGTPNLKVEVPARDAFSLGALLYFFEYACGVSALVQQVNPFDQPGVEEYKASMKQLLVKGSNHGK